MDNDYLAWVNDTLKEFQTRLNLLHYEIEVQPPETHDCKYEGVAASAWIDTAYLRAIISLYPPLEEYYKENKVDYCRKILLHEMCHFFTSPLQEYASPGIPKNAHTFLDQLAESTTQMICNALWNAGLDKPLH